MSDIIDITAFRSPAAPEEDGRQALLARLTQVKEQIARLDLEEPEDMASEAYEILGRPPGSAGRPGRRSDGPAGRAGFLILPRIIH